ncbi:MAG: YggS family pyridoxal phosphate-dependent enzyme [Puniceicoccales bacterium]|jgi:pyridoxal phosphate enzyme (YggS family)|nr:YggS family pyridoxal phosphate-dependent enzyme [Puniceicoccales bacterium]
MISYEEFLENLAIVRARIGHACAACGRDPASVTLLPVTKTHPATAAIYASRAGLDAVAENRVQEGAEKRPMAPASLRWELIGHLQGNKARRAAEVFSRIQTIDGEDLADLLNRVCAGSGKTLPVLLQANSGGDAAKFGVADFDSLQRLADHVLRLPALRLEGLMTIPALDADPSVARRAFETLREWRDLLAARLACPLPVLSMGMSGDLEEAIAAGATHIRIGAALFGDRPAIARIQ